jgi:hypothetical protein
MGRQDKFREKRTGSFKRELKNLEVRKGIKEPLVVLSFKDFDRNQGQSFSEWQDEKLLALTIEKLREICQYTVAQLLQQQIVKVYTKVSFPPNSSFTHPKHVPPDIDWSSMHIQGKPCVIGYFEDNIFHVVFLDKDHQFWKTEKKNT